MSFTDPEPITIAGTALTLPRISVEKNASTYQTGDGLVKLTASHNYGRRIRRMLRIDHAKTAPDPYLTTKTDPVSMSCYIVFDLPTFGYTNQQAKDVYVGFNTLYTATSHALIDKVLGGES